MPPITSMGWQDMHFKKGYDEILANVSSDKDTLIIYSRKNIHNVMYIDNLNDYMRKL